MSPGRTTLEGRLAQLIRVTSSDRNGEVSAAMNALVRALKAAGADSIHALADKIENPVEKPNGGIDEAEMKRLYDRGYAAGVRAAEAKHHGARRLPRRRRQIQPGRPSRSLFSARSTA